MSEQANAVRLLNARTSDRRKERPLFGKAAGKRVAVYCRVSTENEAQESSYENQMKFFYERIQKKPEWQAVGVYADKGITGTCMKRREAFLRLMSDCEAGKIDTILTKGISRFARNTVDLLETVRRLKALGVNVIFDCQGLDTATERSEMLLAIHAAIAQEGSQSISDNVRWSIRRKYRMGEVPWSNVYGYTREGAREYLPDDRRAAAVQRIFALYVAGKTTIQIAKRMQAEGFPAPGKGGRWYNMAVRNILQNEKYRGDALLQKSFVADLLTRKRVLNDRGELPCYYVEGHHEPLVVREVFDRAQVIRRLRCNHHGCPQYPYAERLQCPVCGGWLRQMPVLAQGSRSAWFCTACHGFGIRTSYLNAAVLAAVGGAQASVEYGWLDECVERISFDAEGLCVHGRDGESTHAAITYHYPREQPAHIAALLRKQCEGEGV